MKTMIGGMGQPVIVLPGRFGFVWSMAVVVKAVGFAGGLIAFMFLSVQLTFAPIYAWYPKGDWRLAAIANGGFILGSALLSGGGDGWWSRARVRLSSRGTPLSTLTAIPIGPYRE